MAQVRRIHDVLAETLSSEVGGFEQFEAIEPLRVRAIASDLVLSASDSVEYNLGEAALHALGYRQYVGPNGRRMPGPDSTAEDDLEALRAEADLVGFFRAVGSALDCLSAVAIGTLRLPRELQRADAALLSGGLDQLLDQDLRAAPESQLVWVRRVAAEVSALRSEPVGWLEWLVEMRNQVIHRGRQISAWLPRPAPSDRPKLYVRTETEPAALMRFEPHLRRRPWHPDMEALRAGASELWLAEPCSTTLAGLLGRVNDVAEAICGILVECWRLSTDETSDWAPDVTRWAAVETSPRWRLESAARFDGFDPTYQVPPLTEIRVSGRDAIRLEIAERLRRQMPDELGP